MSILRDEDFYYQYEQKGGTIEMPKEVFWELYYDSKEEIERLNNIINKAIEYIKRYETISGYYDSNYDGEADTYSHDNVKDDLLQMLDKDSDKK